MILNRLTSRPNMLCRFEDASVAVTDAALDATDGGTMEPVRDSLRPSCRDASSCPAGDVAPRDTNDRFSRSLLNRPRSVFRRLLNLREGGCELRGSVARCSADVDCDKGDGTVVLCRCTVVKLDRRGRTGKVGLSGESGDMGSLLFPTSYGDRSWRLDPHGSVLSVSAFSWAV